MKSIQNYALKIILGTLAIASAPAIFADSYIGGDGVAYPYCTKNMPSGSGFGWQPELNGPNGGSCKIPELKFVVNNKTSNDVSLFFGCVDSKSVFIIPWTAKAFKPGEQLTFTCEGPNWIFVQYDNKFDNKQVVVAVAKATERYAVKNFVNRADGKGIELVPAN